MFWPHPDFSAINTVFRDGSAGSFSIVLMKVCWVNAGIPMSSCSLFYISLCHSGFRTLKTTLLRPVPSALKPLLRRIPFCLYPILFSELMLFWFSLSTLHSILSNPIYSNAHSSIRYLQCLLIPFPWYFDPYHSITNLCALGLWVYIKQACASNIGSLNFIHYNKRKLLAGISGSNCRAYIANHTL